MQLTESKIGTVNVIAPVGEIDANSAPQLEKSIKALVDAGESELVVDMSRVSYTSSAGLRVILWGLKEMRRRRGDLRLVGLRPRVQEVFEMAGFLPLFQVFSSTDLAASSFQASAVS